MTVSPSFKWSLIVLGALVIVLVVADQTGFIDRLTNQISPAIGESQATKASATEDPIAQTFTHLEDLLPRLFSQTTDLSKALENYAAARVPARRTELAYDLIALKFKEDLHDKGRITPEQDKIYQNAMAQMKWSGDLLAYYLNHLPESDYENHAVKFGDFQQAVKPDSMKRVLIAGLVPSNAECTKEDLANLRATYPDEFLAMSFPAIPKIFLALDMRISWQLMGQIQGPLMGSIQNASDREVIEALFKIRDLTQSGAHKDENASMDKALQDFLTSKDRNIAFEVFASAPGCFSAHNVIPFARMMQKLQTEVIGRFYLERVREYYAKNHKLPEQLENLRIENPQTEREKFYRSPNDAWGRPLQMKVENDVVTLTSDGLDRKPGTADDVIAAEGPLNKSL